PASSDAHGEEPQGENEPRGEHRPAAARAPGGDPDRPGLSRGRSLRRDRRRVALRRHPSIVSGRGRPVCRPSRRMGGMASYAVNERAVANARRLIAARRYVLESDWGEVQPKADDENDYLKDHSWDEYAEWHLGLTDGVADETKARYAFVFGDF